MHRKNPFFAVLSVLSLLSIARPLAAATLTFTLDPEATTIEFGFGATLHSVEGSLRAKEGKIEFDPETGQASGRIVLDATSAKTGNSRRDAKMHEKILESSKYPEMIYTVERISGTLNRSGRSDIELHGTLDMHGVRRPMDLVGTVKADGDQGDRIAAVGRVTIPYLEWGMLDPSVFILRVEKEVHVEVRATGHLSGGSMH
jgi:polyisoprenoid-binding protein YceI